MGWHREAADADPAELVARTSHELAVAHWQTACRDYLHLCDQMDQLQREINDAARVGHRVLIAWNHGRGRKMVRTADMVRDTIFERLATPEPTL